MTSVALNRAMVRHRRRTLLLQYVLLAALLVAVGIVLLRAA
jgi:hypothetical protein